MAEMEVMKTRCPTGHSCETYSIGQSFEGREMKVLKVCQIVNHDIYDITPPPPHTEDQFGKINTVHTLNFRCEIK